MKFPKVLPYAPLVLSLWLAAGCSSDAVVTTPSDASPPPATDNTPEDQDPGSNEGPLDGVTVLGYDARPANPTCVAPARPVTPSNVAVQRVFPRIQFNNPMFAIQAPNDAGTIWVGERRGVLRHFPNEADPAASTVVQSIDFSSRVNTTGEGGFLGAAFHPEWPTRPELYLSYTTTIGGRMVSVVSRVTSTDLSTFDIANEQRLLTLTQPFENHNGGGIGFSPLDGFLYIGFGDGGSGGDPRNYAQTPGTLLGKYLRIDVNGTTGGLPYRIPADNPFAANAACGPAATDAQVASNAPGCAEIYATGLRNPFRWSFDRLNGELWAGDVGQDLYEEVDIIVRGGNYGWKIREGTNCYQAANCRSDGLIPPVATYGRGEGVSITGGHVYRGNAIPTLAGRFVYGDFQSGNIWALARNATTGTYTPELLVRGSGLSISAFGQLHDGEILVVNLGGGSLHKLVSNEQPVLTNFPDRLSATGCFDAADPKVPVAGLIPYDVNAALWSDGADKARWFAIPDNTTIAVGADGDFDFPNGTVLAKEFSIGGRRVETRLFMRHPDGVWAGYSYEWNDAQTDATLLSDSLTKTVNGQQWYFPSQSQCLVCHTEIAGRSLGLEVAQLNRNLVYPTTRTANQVATLNGLGFLTAPLGTPDTLPRLEAPGGTGPVDARARAYLHSNCSNCHRLGAGQGPQDFRFSLTLPQMNACDTAPVNGDLDVANARIIAPGAPERSIVSLRMRAVGEDRMPPLATSVVDTQGSDLVDLWIRSLSGCQ